MKIPSSVFIIFLAAVFYPLCTNADMINLTGAQLSPHVAEYYIEDDKIVLKLEIGEADKDFFGGLINGDENTKKDFLRNRLFLKDSRGNILDGNVKLIEQRKRTIRPSPINNPPGGRTPSKDVTYVKIEYPFTEKPEGIIFNPPIKNNGAVAVTYGFIVYHENIPVIDFRFLPYNQKLVLDWEDPWFSKFENKNLKRHHSSTLMSFLYIEPYEVRLEILVRLKELREWTDLGIDNKKILTVQEQQEIKKKIAEFIVTRNKLKIDDSVKEPIVDRVQFVRVNLLGIQYYEIPEPIDTVSAVVGIILVYLTDGIPGKVTVDWDMFSEFSNKIPVTNTDPAGPFPDFITPKYSTLVWENYLNKYEIPQVSAVVVEKPLLNSKETVIASVVFSLLVTALIIVVYRYRKESIPAKKHIAAYFISTTVISFLLLYFLLPKYELYQAKRHEIIVESLLKNVYRSFDFKNESDIYDKLSTSIDGDLLRDMYLEIKKNLEYENTGGAKAKIQGLKLENVSPKQLGRGRGYEYDTDWTVSGKVEHWGHIHNRTNRYNALITVKNIDKKWKITDFQLKDEERIMQ